jgi:Mor family transcriptional regulator
MEQLEDARQDYAAGVTFSDLVKKFGVSQNRLRRAIRGRSYGQYGTPAAVRPRTERGEKHHASKLTAEIVVNIRVRYAAGERQTALAREYNVSQPSVRAIILGKTWTHAGGPIAEPKRRKAK